MDVTSAPPPSPRRKRPHALTHAEQAAKLQRVAEYAERLAAAGVNIELMYLATGTRLVFGVDDLEAAGRARVSTARRAWPRIPRRVPGAYPGGRAESGAGGSHGCGGSVSRRYWPRK